MAEVGSAYVSLVPSASGFGSKMESDLKPQVAKSGSSLGATFGKVFAAVGGALIARSSVKFIQESTAGYREHLKVVAQTNAVIKSTGGVANVSAKGVTSLTDSLERQTGVDADAIASGSNLLLTFTNVRNGVGKGNRIFDQATRSITDMGVALGTGPKASAIQLGKALNDPIKGVGALSRVGVSFTEKQKGVIKSLVETGDTMKAQKIILGELSKEFGGSAKAAATPADKARAAYHQLQDEVGKTTVPVMNRLETIFSKKIAPVLLSTAQTYLPRVRKALLGLLDSKKVGSAMSGIGTALAGVNWGKTSSGLQSIGDGLGKIDWQSLQDSLGSGLNDSLSVFGVVIGFAADHVDTLAKYMPLLIAAFVAYKSAQAAARVVAVASLPITLANAAANIVLASSNRKLAAAMTESTAAETVSKLSRIRSTVATVAQTVATAAYSVVQGIATAAAWAFNAALAVLTSPITLVVLGIVAFIAILVLLYKKVPVFRAIVNGAFHAVVEAIKVLGHFATWLWENAFKPSIEFIVNAVATLISIWATMLHGLANIPGFGWADKAADALDAVANKAREITSAMNDIPTTKQITITTNWRNTGTPSTGGHVPMDPTKLATGGRARGSIVEVGDGGSWESIIPDALMVKALASAARAGSSLRSESTRRDRSLRLVVDGYEFNAYVDDRADTRVESASNFDGERGRAAWSQRA